MSKAAAKRVPVSYDPAKNTNNPLHDRRETVLKLTLTTSQLSPELESKVHGELLTAIYAVMEGNGMNLPEESPDKRALFEYIQSASFELAKKFIIVVGRQATS